MLFVVHILTPKNEYVMLYLAWGSVNSSYVEWEKGERCSFTFKCKSYNKDDASFLNESEGKGREERGGKLGFKFLP